MKVLSFIFVFLLHRYNTGIIIQISYGDLILNPKRIGNSAEMIILSITSSVAKLYQMKAVQVIENSRVFKSYCRVKIISGKMLVYDEYILF